MKNKYAFYKARQIEASLNGDNWPEKLTILQIANLHFAECRNEKRALFSLLENSLGAGLLDFDDVTAGYSWSYGVLSDLVGGSNEKEMTSSHTPDSGWGKFFKGLKVGDVKDLSLHLCGCEAVCILEQVFINGLPRIWSVKGIHSDGLKIEFSCRGIPLISPEQHLKFCSENGVNIPNESHLYDWINAKQKSLPKDKADGDPKFGKVRPYLGQNDIADSGLLNEPSRKDDWFQVIDDMTRAFHTDFKILPNEVQAWGKLCEKPPAGYEITTSTCNGEDYLKMPGAPLLSRTAFAKRWAKYTTNSGQ
ncbi:hypothetical protein [Candidatus Methylomicrobium oryzae]|uniref:hypothetical protein n=1 Tax=Candidatus Methylomicrobium oryzae TaxID=2802053 RepID=UPI0019206685|nr:hypothetical protein [Methylomicrobium sp. RS1]MBL1265728.1 hypothetical protein [Methylomicrobium sp. RS1]